MNKPVGQLRPSQLITTFGPGSIVDLPDFSVIIGGVNTWDPNTMLRYSFDIDEPRLKRKLRIKKIKSIPISAENSGFGTIPAYRFPDYHVCPTCRKLGTDYHFSKDLDDGVLYCQNPDKKCPKVKTHPVRFLTACKNGHIDDFPWGFFVHPKNKGKYDFKKCKLYLLDTGKTGSLADLIVRCESCDNQRSISEAFSNEKLLPRCQGRRPWLGRRNRDEHACEQQSKLLLRGASNLYFPVVESSIVVPFQSHPLVDLIRKEIDFDNEELILNKSNFTFYVKMNSELKHYDPEELWSIAQRIHNGEDDDQDLLQPEWDAITSGQRYLDEPDFEVEVQTAPSPLISRLIRVKRLKEVMVIKGFTRIHPQPDATQRYSGETDHEDETNDSAIAPLSDVKLDWLPGVETFGEGIFLSLNENKLSDWESKHHSYGEKLEAVHSNQYRERNIPEEAIPVFPGLRYVLLHTLSHALIRELCLHSGYSASALKERIYSDDKKGMAGILIYTATVDSEGSLGGLVELGKTEHFKSILARALTSAGYCSGDPLCAEHDPEELNDINGAACHSCLLISETSCEKSNRYLDRSVLVSTVANKERQYFTHV
jgi:hypothetical protein